MGNPMTQPVPQVPKPDLDQPKWEWPTLFKNRFFRVILVCGILLAIGIVTISYYPRARLKRISAGEIVVTPVGPGYAQIGGSFTVSSFKVPITSILTQEKIDGISSQGTGGACLIAEWKKFLPEVVPDSSGFYCKTNKECTDALPDERKPDPDPTKPEVPGKWSGYCDKTGNSGKGECWVKPGGKEFCNRSKDYPQPQIWGDGTYLTPKDGPYFVPDYPRQDDNTAGQTLYPGPISWRVVACLNEIDPDTNLDSKGCRENLGMQVLGPVKEVEYGLVLSK